MPKIDFVVAGKAFEFEAKHLVIAGWTGRDPESVKKHIAELEAIGIAPPAAIPCFYRNGNNLLTSNERIEVVGSESSGEVEFVLMATDEELLVGVGSDHTDRNVEAYDITVSKQICPKPISRELWRYSDLQANWDSLMLRSWVWQGGERILYQEGPVARMRTPDDLIAKWSNRSALEPGTVMYCGTLPLLGEMVYGDAFEVTMEDASRGRVLQHKYEVSHLTVAR